jgi:hypothetical protein
MTCLVTLGHGQVIVGMMQAVVKRQGSWREALGGARWSQSLVKRGMEL